MKRRQCINITFTAVILTMMAVFAWHLFLHPKSSANGIGDKLEVYVMTRPTNDSIHTAIRQIDRELDHMSDYFRVHQVTDEGYELVALHRTRLLQRKAKLQQSLQMPRQRVVGQRLISSHQRRMIAVRLQKGYWRAGHFYRRPLSGEAIWQDALRRVTRGTWLSDTIVKASRTDSLGTYHGEMDTSGRARGEGYMVYFSGQFYSGMWNNDLHDGWGFLSSQHHDMKVGEWQNGRFLGERMKYTSERIYGIDISRHQHEKGRKRFSIDWKNIRITSLGSKHNRHVSGTPDYPVSFVYIKATEGTSISNRYYAADSRQARRYGIHVGSYHFFSLKSSATAQARHFLRTARVQKTDFPPVLDVEPTHAQIMKAGGPQQLFQRVRTWCNIVEQATGKRPILYISQTFVNRYLPLAPDIKQHYQVWIARYGEYKPDIRLLFWQLTPEGRVRGIHGPVDINVFNGYRMQYQEFAKQGKS